MLDEYWTSYCAGVMRPVDMLIVNVEGAELKVLRGQARLLANSTSVMIMAECAVQLPEIDELLRAHGLSLCAWDAQAGRLVLMEMRRSNLSIRRDA